MKQCPQCHRQHERSVIRCDCGFDLRIQPEIDEPVKESHGSRKETRFRFLFLISEICYGLAFLSGFVSVGMVLLMTTQTGEPVVTIGGIFGGIFSVLFWILVAKFIDVVITLERESAQCLQKLARIESMLKERDS